MPRGIPNSGQRRQSRRNTAGNKTGQQQNTLTKGQINQLGKFHGLVGNILQQHGWSGGASQGSGRGRGRAMTGTRRTTTGTRQRKLAATG